MKFYADLHVHSRYSRATSRDADLEHLALSAGRKGLTVVATGDFTHPAWFAELKEKLVPAEPGLFRLRPELEREVARRLPASCQAPTRFLLEVEISTIYKKGEKTRKVHHLIYAASFETAARLRERLAAIGNLASDGRPILGLDSRHLLEITLESGPDAFLIPAHIWTPWFSALGSKSGFDSIEECYGDLAGQIFAAETGLSSDPPMNGRVSALDRFTLVSNSDAHSPPMLGREACRFDCELSYFALRRALETRQGYEGTVEFFPEEGKYHLDGHRACGVRLEPEETRAAGGRCPACGKPVTVGVMHRVLELADRPEDHQRPENFRSLVPLAEILAELLGVGAKSASVERAAAGLAERLGPELELLAEMPADEVRRQGEGLLAEALERLRAGAVRREAGYDGEYGVIRLFEPGELARKAMVASLFGPIEATVEPEPARPERAALGRPALDGGERAQQLGLFGPSPERAAGRPRSFLDDLDPKQRAAAEWVGGPLLILAGPGTGKTRTLTHRLAYLVAEQGVAPERCLALSFSRRSAAELAERLAALLGPRAASITTGTFHSLGLALLREFGEEAELAPEPRVATPEEVRALVAEQFGVPAGEVLSWLGDLGRVRRLGALGEELSEATAALVARYEAELAGRGWLDFESLILKPLELFGRRAELGRRVAERYAWISIDEYQDLDALQYRLIRLLVGPGSKLCAIGDPDQSIYGFRGADVGLFLRFEEDFPGARRFELGRNYRSSRAIVESALAAVRPSSLVPGRRLRAVAPGEGAAVVCHEAASERAEAEWLLATLEELLGGTSTYSLDSGRSGGHAEGELSLGDVAVLYRMEAQAAAIHEALAREGIPAQVRSHHPLAERPGVATLLRALAGQAGLGTAEPERPERTVEARVDALALELGGASARGGSALWLAAELLRPLALRHGEDLAAFLSAVALGSEVDTWDGRAERVSLLTLHAAKGLEFPVVFLVGCEEGLLPLRVPGQEVDLAEERRLFFVGMTRARTRLYLSHARERSLWGTRREMRPSSFLAALDPRWLERTGSATEGPARPRQLRLL
ncbi:MAG: UvrD-helicase domain-containing protein [Thermoanaerobaculia bacterium]